MSVSSTTQSQSRQLKALAEVMTATNKSVNQLYQIFNNFSMKQAHTKLGGFRKLRSKLGKTKASQLGRLRAAKAGLELLQKQTPTKPRVNHQRAWTGREAACSLPDISELKKIRLKNAWDLKGAIKRRKKGVGRGTYARQQLSFVIKFDVRVGGRYVAHNVWITIQGPISETRKYPSLIRAVWGKANRWIALACQSKDIYVLSITYKVLRWLK